MGSRQPERLGVVRAYRDDLHVIVAVGELIGGSLERRSADIDEHTARRIDQRVEELLGLEADSRAELDERRVRADGLGHFMHRFAHDAELGARRIVLGKLGDRLEQASA